MNNNRLILPVLLATALWFMMFSPWTAPYLNFWICMGISASILTLMSFLLRKDMRADFKWNIRSIVIGLVSAVVLWLVFYIGEAASTAIFNFARPQVDSIYSMKDGFNKVALILALLFIIGPAEEIFWRGYIQHSLSLKYGSNKAFIFTTLLYALVHIWSFNFMLIMVALVCGIFWGLMYKYSKNLASVCISHAIWDVAVFIIFPIM